VKEYTYHHIIRFGKINKNTIIRLRDSERTSFMQKKHREGEQGNKEIR